MLIVPIEEATAGMTLAMNVTHPEQPEQDLLKAGYTLNDDILKRLREKGVETLYVDYPDLGDLDRHMAAVLSPARQQVYQQIRDTIAAVQKTAQPSVSFPDYYSSTRDLVITLMQGGQHAVYLDHMSGRMGNHAVAHATAVAHLSLMLGLKLETYLIQQRSRLSAQHAREVVNLGVAGMLHDIGLAALPEPIRKCSRVEPPEDEAAIAEWQTHPQRGYDMLKGGIEASAAAAVLHHHQHFDGSGFPAPGHKPQPGEEPRNAGNRIHVFSRILAAADLYDRLTVGRAGHRRPNVEILFLMRTRYAGWLDPQVMTVVPTVIPPFPPGMKVTLSDGTEAVTVGLRPDAPFHPTVRRVEDAGSWRLAKESIDLSVDGLGLSITSASGVAVTAEMIPAPTKKGKRPAQPETEEAAVGIRQPAVA